MDGMRIFEMIERLKDEIPENEQKEMVARIISILKECNITYNQAYGILNLADATLKEMSRALSL